MIYKPTKISNALDITELFCLYLQHFCQGYVFSGEMHDFWECVYVIDGEVCISSDERMYNLRKGDIVFHKEKDLGVGCVKDTNGVDKVLVEFGTIDKDNYKRGKHYAESCAKGAENAF